MSFCWFFTRLFNPYWAALAACLLLVVYTCFVEGSASVFRALVMAVMGAGGRLIGRRQSSGLNALGFTAAGMCLVNPLLLKDISFQLSFAATFGLVVFAQPLSNWLKGLLEKRVSEKSAAILTKPLSEYFLYTLAAQFATLPVIAHHFGRISISSLIANPLVLPVQPAVLVAGGITTIAGMVNPLLGKFCMLFSWPLLKYTNWMVVLLARIKGGSLTIHPAFSILILIVSLLFVLAFFLRERFKKIFHSGSTLWLLFFLSCACVTVWSIYLHKPDGLLHIHLVRCEDEASLFMQTPGGELVMLDPRGDVNELTSALEGTLSPWEYHLDAVFLTDRISALHLSELTERVPVNRIFLAPSIYRIEADEKAVTLPDGIDITKLLVGQEVEIEPDVSLTLVAEDLNGTALLLRYGSLKVLIPNGVDYAEIRSFAPESMQGLTALLLGPPDISTIPPRVWRQLDPGILLWKDITLSPFQESYGVDTDVEVNLVSNGKELWIEN